MGAVKEKKALPAVFNWMRGDGTYRIYTSDNMMLTRLKKLSAKGEEQYRVSEIGYDQNHEAVSVTVEVPPRCVMLRAGNKRELTEEEREALRVRMAKIQAAGKRGRSDGTES